MPQSRGRTIALATAAAVVLGGAAMTGAAITTASSEAHRCDSTIEAVREVLDSSAAVVSGQERDQLAWETLANADTDLLWLDTMSCQALAPSLAEAVAATYAAHVDRRNHLLSGSPMAWIRAQTHLQEAERLLEEAAEELARSGERP